MDWQVKNQVRNTGSKSLVSTLSSELSSSSAFVMIMAMATLLTTGCEKGDRSFSLLSESEVFEQKTAYVPRQIDILWVIDNSGSMQSSQTNLTNNFQSFIQGFQSRNLDFRMGVTTTDAYLGKFRNENYRRRLRDGVTTHSGVFVMDRNTTNLSNVFLTNATQGINGNGDERAFSSFIDTLDYTGNNDFGRAGSFLSIIIVSDEDDFSATTSSSIGQNYNSANIIPVSNYVTALNNLKGAGNYSVNTISILDTACLNSLQDSSQIVSQRYQQLASLTGGQSMSICANFGTSLDVIAGSILEMASSFSLSREPVVSSIRIHNNGVPVAQDSVNGWSYNPTGYTITFHGNAIPAEGDDVQVSYDPTKPKN